MTIRCSVVALLLVSACAPAETADVFIELRTDVVAGLEFDRVRVELRDVLPSGTVSGAVTRDVEVSVTAGLDFSTGRRVAEITGVPFGHYVVRLQMFRGPEIRVERSIEVEITANRAITILVTRSCAGVTCPAPGGDEGQVSCLSGSCVAPSCVEGDEPSCPPPGCEAAGDCPAAADCADRECVRGVCFFAPVDGACELSEVCSPERGCVPVGGCVPLPETCDGSDEDCDGLVDEDFDFDADVLNCGTCGTACPSAPGATPACGAGTCTVECDPGFGDCDGDAVNGCERDVGTATDCGACDAACPPAEPACSPDGDGGFSCVSGCPTETPTLCGTSCVATSGDTRHCGACGVACELANAAATCLGGSCEVLRCDPGYADCDGDPGNGCEIEPDSDVMHCGACDAACGAVRDGTASCIAGSCRVDCSTGFRDCDGEYATGCEVNTGSDVTQCGSCGQACVSRNGTSICADGICTVSSCDTGYGDCDSGGYDYNGCETVVDTDTSNCGACDVVCDRWESCNAGRCDCYGTVGTVGGGPACGPGVSCCRGPAQCGPTSEGWCDGPPPF